MNLTELFLSALIFIFPAYCTNAAPVIFGGGGPIDCGKSFIDGKPLFGSHKTVRGFISGLASGILATIALCYLVPYNFFVGVALSIGALIGDLAGSFIKRRLSFPPGKSVPVLDQMTFVVFAVIFAYAVSPIEIEIMLIVFVVTPVCHLVTNLIAYCFGLKTVPW